MAGRAGRAVLVFKHFHFYRGRRRAVYTTLRKVSGLDMVERPPRAGCLTAHPKISLTHERTSPVIPTLPLQTQRFFARPLQLLDFSPTILIHPFSLAVSYGFCCVLYPVLVAATAHMGRCCGGMPTGLFG